MAKRLIYADEIENLFYAQVEHGATDLMDAFDDALQDAQTVDAAEVCYCKDCRYARPLNDTEKLVYLDECKACYNGDATIDGYNIVMPEHFCSYGERKDG